MNYGNLINRAFNLAWNHKVFWVLGFFSAAWGYIGGFEEKFPQFSVDDFGHFHSYAADDIIDWIMHGPGLAIVIAVIGLVFLIGLIFFVLHFISVAGLIDGVVRVERGISSKLQELFRTGTRYFWKFLALFFLTGLVGGVFAVLLIVPLILAIIALKLLGILFLIFIIPIGFVGIFFLSNLYSLTQREIVIYDAHLFDAIRESYYLLIKNLGPNIIIFLIETFLLIAIIICGFIMLVIFAIPTIIIGAWSPLFMIIALIVILPVFLALAVIIEGFLGTFFNSFFTYFYLELREKMPRQSGTTSPETAA